MRAISRSPPARRCIEKDIRSDLTYHYWAIDTSAGNSGTEPLIRFGIHLISFIVEIVSCGEKDQKLIQIS